VREAFAALVKTASDAELVKQILAAASEIDYRLRIYPQFGQPLRDLSVKNASLWDWSRVSTRYQVHHRQRSSTSLGGRSLSA